ncbi:MAG: hypothetical protein EBR88_01575 [Betaproteobacteria bacterium]|nr:hypothetical protein [Betaproteobacteria bacterium]
MQTTYFFGTKAYKAPPTKSHVPAVWECMLGAVYARNAQGETRYFDYNYEAARAWAGLGQGKLDIRVSRAKESTGGPEGIRKGQLVLWVRRPVQSTST